MRPSQPMEAAFPASATASAVLKAEIAATTTTAAAKRHQRRCAGSRLSRQMTVSRPRPVNLGPQSPHIRCQAANGQ